MFQMLKMLPPSIPSTSSLVTPPTKEKLVEWLFLHNKQHPIELVEAALAAKGMLPVFSNSLTQQMDHIRRVMVHSSSLLLLATV